MHSLGPLFKLQVPSIWAAFNFCVINGDGVSYIILENDQGIGMIFLLNLEFVQFLLVLILSCGYLYVNYFIVWRKVNEIIVRFDERLSPLTTQLLSSLYRVVALPTIEYGDTYYYMLFFSGYVLLLSDDLLLNALLFLPNE